ncbi:MAG: D-tyrosyl-tRNA(Tyr) deacylase [Deltaproteobacteria bacterium]|nr:D-tyrosyl-tRNA(Tyr) deacylase [Deltaproteobacteria bacterium]
MKVVLQRVKQASVSVDNQIVGEIGQGLLLLVGFGQNDSETALKPMAEKLINLRIFSDNGGKFNLSLLDIEGEILAISQFTLYGDTRKGRRPDFTAALNPTEAEKLYNQFLALLKTYPLKKIASGVFAAHMDVALINDGPVTLTLDC